MRAAPGAAARAVARKEEMPARARSVSAPRGTPVLCKLGQRSKCCTTHLCLVTPRANANANAAQHRKQAAGELCTRVSHTCGLCPAAHPSVRAFADKARRFVIEQKHCSIVLAARRRRRLLCWQNASMLPAALAHADARGMRDRNPHICAALQSDSARSSRRRCCCCWCCWLQLLLTTPLRLLTRQVLVDLLGRHALKRIPRRRLLGHQRLSPE